MTRKTRTIASIERLEDLVDRDLHEGRRVVDEDDLHAGREEPRELGHLRLDPVGGLERVRPRLLPDREDAGRLPVEPELEVGDLGPELGPADVLHLHDRPVRVRPERDRRELLRRLQERLDEDRGVEALARDGRRAAELAGRDLDVVGPERQRRRRPTSSRTSSACPGRARPASSRPCRRPGPRRPRGRGRGPTRSSRRRSR